MAGSRAGTWNMQDEYKNIRKYSKNRMMGVCQRPQEPNQRACNNLNNKMINNKIVLVYNSKYKLLMSPY